MSTATGLRRVSWRTVSDTREDEGHTDSNHHTEVETGTVSTVFADRVRALLGVTRGKVSVTRETDEINIYGCETFESWESVTITIGKRSRTFEGLDRLFARLEAIDLDAPGPHAVTYTAESLLQQWHQIEAEFVFADGRVWRGRVGNARGHQVLLIGATRPPKSDYGSDVSGLVPVASIDLVRAVPGATS